jgi:hypothetical protein
MPDGSVIDETLNYNEVKLHKLGLDENRLPLEAKIDMYPTRHFDAGEGYGKQVKGHIARGGVVGIAMDGRGRPLLTTPDRTKRIRQIQSWNEALNCYPQRGGGR